MYCATPARAATVHHYAEVAGIEASSSYRKHVGMSHAIVSALRQGVTVVARSCDEVRSRNRGTQSHKGSSAEKRCTIWKERDPGRRWSPLRRGVTLLHLPLLGSVTVAYCRPWSIRLEPCLVPATFRKGVVAAAERTEHTLSSLAGRPCAEPGSLQTRGCRLVVQCRTRKLKT